MHYGHQGVTTCPREELAESILSLDFNGEQGDVTRTKEVFSNEAEEIGLLLEH